MRKNTMTKRQVVINKITNFISDYAVLVFLGCVILTVIWMIISQCIGNKQVVEGVTATEVTNIVEMEYKGHDYIMFNQGFGTNRQCGVVHNPDCKLCNSK